MKLYIRSQDRKRLVPNPNLYVVYDEKNEIAYIGDTGVGHIGKYKTEERALEVLDEIQKIIKWCQKGMKDVTIGDMNNLKGCFEDYVYEMPKE